MRMLPEPQPQNGLADRFLLKRGRQILQRYNMGQYFTLWDRIGGTYRNPSPFEGRGPHEVLLVLFSSDPFGISIHKSNTASAAVGSGGGGGS